MPDGFFSKMNRTDREPPPALMHHGEAPDEESEETKLLREAAAALGADPQHADLVTRINDCLAEHGGSEKPAAVIAIAPDA